MNGHVDDEGYVRIPQKYFAAWAFAATIAGGGLSTGIQMVAPAVDPGVEQEVQNVQQRLANLERAVVAFATSGPVEVRKSLDRIERKQDRLEELLHTIGATHPRYRNDS